MHAVAVVIPTRNRPEKLQKLLSSIANSSVKPKQVVVVSSGVIVQSVIDLFMKSLSITYVHSQVAGQAAQKKLAIKMIDQEVEWCLFSDDDVLFDTEAIANALEIVEVHDHEEIIGVGFSLPPTSRVLEKSVMMQKLARLFLLDSKYPGRVLASGHASSYLHQKQITCTEWLNGVSMWRIGFARDYGKNIISTPYAACEDLIFSYPLSKIGKLIFVPSAKVEFQEGELSDFNSWNVFRSASIWRYYFVCKNQDLSIAAFLWSQFFRTLYLVSQTKQSRLKLSFLSLKLNFRIVFDALLGKDPRLMINSLLNENP